jgi:hypothetical protein
MSGAALIPTTNSPGSEPCPANCITVAPGSLCEPGGQLAGGGLPTVLLQVPTHPLTGCSSPMEQRHTGVRCLRRASVERGCAEKSNHCHRVPRKCRIRGGTAGQPLQTQERKGERETATRDSGGTEDGTGAATTAARKRQPGPTRVAATGSEDKQTTSRGTGDAARPVGNGPWDTPCPSFKVQPMPFGKNIPIYCLAVTSRGSGTSAGTTEPRLLSKRAIGGSGEQAGDKPVVGSGSRTGQRPE